MQKGKHTVSLLILLGMFITHAVINRKYDYRGTNFEAITILLSINIILLFYAAFILLNKKILLPNFFFWLTFLWFTPDLFNFLAEAAAGIGMKILFWIEYLLLLIFLLRANALFEEVAENSETTLS